MTITSGGSLLGDPKLVLCSLSIVPIGFRGLVAAATAAGFDGISVGPPVYRRAMRDEGLNSAEMRRIVDDSGLWVSEVEAAGNWLTPPEDKPPRWAQRASDEELVALAESLGARTIVACHLGSARPVEEAAASFASLCDRAGRSGLTVALEFPAFATINDMGAAWDIVRLADRPNGGIMLDSWHYYRGCPDRAVLQSVPAERIVGLQLADADTEVQGCLEDDLLLRLPPGEGSLDLVGLLADLDSLGVRAPVAVEVWNEKLVALGPALAARRLATALSKVVAQARCVRGGSESWGR